MTIRVLDPTPGALAGAARMAPPSGALAGRTVGLLDNGKINVSVFLDHVERILRDEHGVREVVRRRKRNQSAPAPPEMLRDLSSCDAVVSAVGD